MHGAWNVANIYRNLSNFCRMFIASTDIAMTMAFRYIVHLYSLPPPLSFSLAWLHGDPRKVLHPTDSNGQFCGQTGTSNKPILFYFNILKCANPAILINLQCPTTQVLQQQTQLQLSHCGFYLKRGHQSLNLIHWPVPPENQLKGLLMSLFVSLVFLLLLRFTVGLLLWTIIISVMVLLAYGIWGCSTEWSRLRHRPGADVSITEVGLHADLHVYLQLRQTWIILLVSMGITEASVVVALFFLRGRVQVAISLLREASKAIGHMMPTLFYPVVTFLLLIICISYWAVTAVYLASSGEAIYKVMSPNVSCPYANSTCSPQTFNRTNISMPASCHSSQCQFAFYGGETPYHHYLFLLQLFNLAVFLWLVNFSLALEQCTLAGTFASYYWAKRKPKDIPPHPLFFSFSKAVRYHTGSLAFGALILSVVQFFRIILEYLERRLKVVDNSLSRFIMCCLRCCLWCLEKFLRYMNHNAYIMLAIYGKNFCTSGRDAFCLLMRNLIRVAVLDRVTDFLLFLGKMLIAGGVSVFAFLFFTKRLPLIQEEVPNLNYYWIPLLVRPRSSHKHMYTHVFFSFFLFYL
uniref:Choline transporter-like protein n=1 Tax=Echeneis naucrates TaxID=173247 RepID=A0A665UEB6_ECHNA